MPRRGHNEGNIRKRPDGRWESRVRLPDGRRKSFYGKTRAEVARKLALAFQALEQGAPMGDERVTVGEFLDVWLEDGARPTVKPSTLEGYERALRLHIKPHLGHMRLRELTPYHVQRWLNILSDGGMATSTIRVQLAILRRALGQGESWGMVPRNVARLIDGPTIHREERVVLDASDARRLLDQVRGDRYEALWLIALSTGARQGEILGLRWIDIDLDAGLIHIRQALIKRTGAIVFGPPKTAAGARSIPITKSSIEMLRSHRERQDSERENSSDWEDYGLVFPSSRGTPLDHGRVRTMLHRHLEAAGLKRMRFHDLRHSCATLLLAQGVDLKTISAILGHASIAITANLYAQVLPDLKADAAQRLEAAFRQSESEGS